MWRLLAPDGKICIVIGDVPDSEDGTQRRNPTHCNITEFMNSLGARFWAEWIWDKIQRGGGLYAFGSYPYPTNFLPRDIHEHILIFRKDGKPRPSSLRPDIKKASTIDKYTWAQWQQSVWRIPTVAKNERHPAMFPNDIPHRLIRLFSFPEDLVADFFMGSGTAAEEAESLNRHFFGVDINPDYVRMAEERLGTVQMSYLT